MTALRTILDVLQNNVYIYNTVAYAEFKIWATSPNSVDFNLKVFGYDEVIFMLFPSRYQII